ncbi:MAG: CPBP family intramembrane glutamic endopeptidase [Tepidisphaeraceae bacterium]
MPTTQPDAAAHVIGSLPWLVVALIAMWAMGVFRHRSIEGPPRLGPGVPARPLFLVALLGGGAWLFSHIAYGSLRAAQFSESHPGQTFGSKYLTGLDYALLSTIPPLLGLIVLVVGDRLAARGLLRRVGYGLSRLPGGLLFGALAMVVVVPLMIGASSLLEGLYQLTDYRHPPAHEVLTAMKKGSTAQRAALIFGATIAAPLFEELLFRGHIQTLLSRLFQFQSSGRSHAWLAVIMASIPFALVHPLWTTPLIFLLALCLGYAYERTGNLWVPIVMHALFNTGSTIVFLYFG